MEMDCTADALFTETARILEQPASERGADDALAADVYYGLGSIRSFALSVPCGGVACVGMVCVVYTHHHLPCVVQLLDLDGIGDEVLAQAMNAFLTLTFLLLLKFATTTLRNMLRSNRRHRATLLQLKLQIDEINDVDDAAVAFERLPHGQKHLARSRCVGGGAAAPQRGPLPCRAWPCLALLAYLPAWIQMPRCVCTFDVLCLSFCAALLHTRGLQIHRNAVWRGAVWCGAVLCRAVWDRSASDGLLSLGVQIGEPRLGAECRRRWRSHTRRGVTITPPSPPLAC